MTNFPFLVFDTLFIIHFIAFSYHFLYHFRQKKNRVKFASARRVLWCAFLTRLWWSDEFHDFNTNVFSIGAFPVLCSFSLKSQVNFIKLSLLMIDQFALLLSNLFLTLYRNLTTYLQKSSANVQIDIFSLSLLYTFLYSLAFITHSFNVSDRCTDSQVHTQFKCENWPILNKCVKKGTRSSTKMWNFRKNCDICWASWSFRGQWNLLFVALYPFCFSLVLLVIFR